MRSRTLPRRHRRRRSASSCMRRPPALLRLRVLRRYPKRRYIIRAKVFAERRSCRWIARAVRRRKKGVGRSLKRAGTLLVAVRGRSQDRQEQMSLDLLKGVGAVNQALTGFEGRLARVESRLPEVPAAGVSQPKADRPDARRAKTQARDAVDNKKGKLSMYVFLLSFARFFVSTTIARPFRPRNARRRLTFTQLLLVALTSRSSDS